MLTVTLSVVLLTFPSGSQRGTDSQWSPGPQPAPGHLRDTTPRLSSSSSSSPRSSWPSWKLSYSFYAFISSISSVLSLSVGLFSSSSPSVSPPDSPSSNIANCIQRWYAETNYKTLSRYLRNWRKLIVSNHIKQPTITGGLQIFQSSENSCRYYLLNNCIYGTFITRTKQLYLFVSK